MRYEVNVSPGEICSAIESIESFRYQIEEHASAVEKAYNSVSEKLSSLRCEYEESYNNISSDIQEAKYIYSCNEVELDKKDAEVAKSAASGTTPPKCDRSVQTDLRSLINEMERQKSNFYTSIRNIDSSLNALESSYRELKRFYDKVLSELSQCINMAGNARDYIRRAARALSFGERSDGTITITSVATLSAYAQSFMRAKNRILDGNDDISSALNSFSQTLTDDVTRLSEDVVGSVTGEVAQAADMLSQASRALNDAARVLSEYLRVE